MILPIPDSASVQDGAVLPTQELTIMDCLYRAAREVPDRIAVQDQHMCLTYAELARQVENASLNIRQLGLARGAPLGTLMRRSVNWVVVLLAINHSGHVYVPLNPKNPPQRNQALMEKAQIEALIADLPHSFDVPAVPTASLLEPGQPPDHLSRAPLNALDDDVCYLFTSGSTGMPKCMVYTERELSAFIQSMRAPFDVPPDLVYNLLQVCECSFDIHLMEVLTPLFFQGTITVLEKGEFFSLKELTDCVGRFEVNVVALPATLWHEWSAAMQAGLSMLPPSLRYVWVAGEKPIYKHFYGPHIPASCKLYNLYGPAETIVYSSFFEARNPPPPGPEVPAGVPVPNQGIAIVNERQEVVPLGTLGEVFIFGQGIASGYKNDAAATQKKFVRLFLGDRPVRGYLSGDMGWIGQDRLLYIAGRNDNEVKINGKRFNLDEVDSKLCETDGVRNACSVVVVADGGEDKTLVSFIETDRPALADGIRSLLTVHFPNHMVPRHVVALARFPRTVNGKTDRRALKEHWVSSQAAPTPQHQAAGLGELERHVLRIWCETTRCPPTGADVMNRPLADLENSSLKRGLFLAEVLYLHGLEAAYEQFVRCSTLSELCAVLRTLKEPA